jgi:membrane protease subunit HflK
MNEQPPWGQKKKPSGPEDFLATLLQKIRDSFAGKEEDGGQGGAAKPSQSPPNLFAGFSKLLAIAVAVVFLQGAFSSFFNIKPVRSASCFVRKYNRPPPRAFISKSLFGRMAKVDVETVRKKNWVPHAHPGFRHLF